MQGNGAALPAIAARTEAVRLVEEAAPAMLSEPLAGRRDALVTAVVAGQLRRGLNGAAPDGRVTACEPVGAIGSGITPASPEIAALNWSMVEAQLRT